MKHFPILLCTAVVLAIACKTKSNQPTVTAPIDPLVIVDMWKKIDSLENKGLFSSALEQVREIKRSALANHFSEDIIKAVLYENRFLIQLEEDSAIKALARAESEMESFPEPAKSVMHSLAAQWYTNYLQLHLWELRNRTEFAGEPGQDIHTWGIRHFIDKIEMHYSASVIWEGLKTSAVQDYLILLTSGNETDQLRPTLYDILMHRALDYFSGAESFLVKSPYDFILTDPVALGPVKTFVDYSFATEDSTSTTWHAIQWFQQLLDTRLKDETHDAALLDADLKRLRFVYDHITAEHKDSLYEKALDHLSEKFLQNDESTIVDFYKAQLYFTQAGQWQPGTDTPDRFGYKKAKEICQRAIEMFPGAYGTQLCKSLILQIDHKSVSASMESISLPDEELLLNLEYRNISDIHLKLVKLPEAPRSWRTAAQDVDQMIRKLNQMPSVKKWKASFDAGGDYQVHHTELPIPALPLGHYALVISDSEDFSSGKSTSGVVMLTISKLAYWYFADRKDENKIAVIHRQTGQPVSDVKVELISYEYNSGMRQQEEIKLSEGISDHNGWVPVPNYTNKNILLRLTKGEDELFVDESYYTYRGNMPTNTRPTTLFFADRAIYRPGQKLFFKGYALNFDTEQMPSIAPNQPVTVTCYDANGQEVSKSSFTSNAYGTFFGHFDIPTGGLTGRMSLSSSHGGNRLFFQVEEYKRPKFEVTFDTLKQIVRLGEEVKITGRAENYSGNPVSGAAVGYRVERVEYRPWWFSYARRYWGGQSDRQVLVTGKTISMEDGRIEITFPANPKSGGDPDMMYRFEITLSVTDITGESHEASKSIAINRQGYEVQIDLGDRISIEALATVGIQASNADEAEVNVSGDVTVSTLKGPGENKRDRIWSSPDIISIDQSTYEKSFSNYMLPDRENMSTWPVEEVIGKLQTSVIGNASVDLSALIKTAGYYKVEWNWKDETGKSMIITQYIMVYAKNQLLPGHEVVQVQVDGKSYQPQEEVRFNINTGLIAPPKTIRLVEKRLDKTETNLLSLPVFQNHAIKLTERDRGGLYVHHLTIYNNRFFENRTQVNVPWSNKELDIHLKTWRDKIEPGDYETWTITVEGQKKEKVEAEMVLSMYDASLDAFVPHQWRMSLYPVTISSTQIYSASPKISAYRGLSYNWRQHYQDVKARQYRDINTYGYYPEGGYYPQVRGTRAGAADLSLDGEAVMESRPSSAPTAEANELGSEKKLANESALDQQADITPSTPVLRSSLDETVFFYPQVNTDSSGSLTFNFKMKEGLTKWKFQALGHTKDLAFGLTEAEVVTQKQLMVFPNPPRFFREGDTIAFQIKVVNMISQPLTGITQLKIIDAFSNEDVSKKWGIKNGEQSLSIAASGTSPVNWELFVPKGWVRPVKYQVFASAGEFTDGEEAFLPVVTNRILVTETLPLPMKANENRTFIFKSMLDNTSATSVDHLFSVEMTTSPAWYAVQALPYLMEYPHECAEQTFSRLYANALAAHIVEEKPSIRQVYDAWRASESDALMSNLAKNTDLKSAMLEETPWVRDAMGETQQKKDIALLFDENRMKNEGNLAVDKLRQMQMSSGGFPWFPGGRDSWYITQYIVEGFGHLKKLGVTIPSGNRNDIVQNAIPYLDARMMEWYNELKDLETKGKIKMEDHQIGVMQIHYLYVCSFFPEIKHRQELEEIKSYCKSQIEKYWLKHGLYDQGLMALTGFRLWPQSQTANEILASLRERTILQEELGRYWKTNAGYRWNEAPVELQSLMIEVYQEMKVGQAETDELRVWLLKNKQTTQWKTTKATASAIYALLIHPDSWLESVGVVSVKLGDKQVIGDPLEGEPGTGYIRKSWDGDEIDTKWSTITVSNPNHHIAWGSAYWQYWEDLDKVKSGVEDNPLKVSRILLKVNNTDRGEESAIAINRGLKVGDKLLVRLIIETDRAMEFVHLKDLRAAGFEPTDVLSGYRWGAGLGYYQSTKDLATHFFIDYLPRGKYVIEYPVTVAQAGAYSEGLATLQCMYAPEYGSHTAGTRVAATW